MTIRELINKFEQTEYVLDVFNTTEGFIDKFWMDNQIDLPEKYANEEILAWNIHWLGKVFDLVVTIK